LQLQLLLCILVVRIADVLRFNSSFLITPAGSFFICFGAAAGDVELLLKHRASLLLL
jgi:hypothetical protein